MELASPFPVLFPNIPRSLESLQSQGLTSSISVSDLSGEHPLRTRNSAVFAIAAIAFESG